jgi:hypothetical protein
VKSGLKFAIGWGFSSSKIWKSALVRSVIGWPLSSIAVTFKTQRFACATVLAELGTAAGDGAWAISAQAAKVIVQTRVARVLVFSAWVGISRFLCLILHPLGLLKIVFESVCPNSLPSQSQNYAMESC